MSIAIFFGSIPSIKQIITVIRERSLGRRFDDFTREHGLFTEHSAPATPAQNGASERSWGGDRDERSLPSNCCQSSRGFVDRNSYGSCLSRKCRHEITTIVRA